MVELGRVTATSHIIETITQYDIDLAIQRHRNGDWGEVCEDDWEANERALVDGDRILSIYVAENNTKFYIITEGFDDNRITTVLLPEGY